jgi:type VI protein secretion system component VasK
VADPAIIGLFVIGAVVIWLLGWQIAATRRELRRAIHKEVQDARHELKGQLEELKRQMEQIEDQLRQVMEQTRRR